MTTLMEEMGHMGPCCYWILVEMCAEKLDKKIDDNITEDDCKFEFHLKIVRKNLHIGATNLQLFLNICSTLDLLSFKKVDNVLHIQMPKLLECLDRDQKKARQLRAVSAPKIKNKDKEEDKDKEYISSDVQNAPQSLLPFSDLEFFHEIKPINPDLAKVWLASYPEDWLRAELTKARMWCLANPKKKPRATGPFLNNWFSRGWEQYRRTIPSSKEKPAVFDYDPNEGKEAV